MKKIYLILITLISIVFNSKAQQPPCEGGCVQVSQGTYIDVLCRYNWSGTYDDGVNPPVVISINNEPCIFVMVNYTIFNCNGVQKLQIDGTVFFNNQQAFNEAYLSQQPFVQPALSNGEITNTSPCAFYSNADIIQAQINAVGKLVATLGIPANVDVYYKGSCFSLVEIQWPAGATKTYPAGGDNPTGGPITIKLSNSKTTISIPCNDACCKVTYEYRIRTTSTGLTEFYYQPTYAPADESCSMSPLPDYNNYPYRMDAEVIDPVTGVKTTVYGSVINQEPCELICNKYNAPPPGSFTTDVKNITEKHVLELTANPTLFNSFIKFTANKAIKNVTVYDMTGKKVMTTTLPENNELNTVELKQGQYFIQVNFIDNSVKTIKVMKQ
jgi:hypothetical protein